MSSRVVRRGALIAVALLGLTLLGFLTFPGHTYLQSDTQIYIPIFERIENPALYGRDFMLSTAHVGLTIYDETAIALRRVTHGNFENVLEFEQFVFRLLGLWGVFLIATGLGLGPAEALLLAACYGLGATIVGPAVLSVEYEPVPRGFAVSALLLASGLLMHGRFVWASVAASIAFLYHPPATIPFWILFGIAVVRQKRWNALWPTAAAVVVLGVSYLLERPYLPSQPLAGVIDATWESIIRFRTPYDLIAEWPPGAVAYIVVAGAVSLAALWRIWPRTSALQRLFLGGWPLLGVLSLAVSWLLFDISKLALMAQLQPARGALFTIVFAQLNCALAGLFAARDKRWLETPSWFLPVFLPPLVPMVLYATPTKLAIVLVLAALACFTLITARRTAAPATALAACFLIPVVAGVQNYPRLHSPELNQLSDWARSQTPVETLFVFPNEGQSLEQGVFRAKAQRSLYTDWKAGGQVNYFRAFALDWNQRWQELSKGKLSPNDWSSRGVDYLIYTGPRTETLGAPVFENTRFRAYQLPRP